jgi:hypothetical protein
MVRYQVTGATGAPTALDLVLQSMEEVGSVTVSLTALSDGKQIAAVTGPVAALPFLQVRMVGFFLS